LPLHLRARRARAARRCLAPRGERGGISKYRNIGIIASASREERRRQWARQPYCISTNVAALAYSYAIGRHAAGRLRSSYRALRHA